MKSLESYYPEIQIIKTIITRHRHSSGVPEDGKVRQPAGQRQRQPAGQPGIFLATLPLIAQDSRQTTYTVTSPSLSSSSSSSSLSSSSSSSSSSSHLVTSIGVKIITFTNQCFPQLCSAPPPGLATFQLYGTREKGQSVTSKTLPLQLFITAGH